MSSGGAPREAAACPEACFRSLMEQATAAHNEEVRRLRKEVQRLQQQQLRLGAPPGSTPPSTPARGDRDLEREGPRGAPAPAAPGEAPSGAGGHPPTAGAVADEPPSPAKAASGGKTPRTAGLAEAAIRHQPSSSSSSRDKSFTKKMLSGGGGGSLSDRLSNVPTGRMHAASEARRRAELDKSYLWKIVNSATFEVVVGTAIVLNGVLMAKEAQYTGFELAEYTGHPSKSGSSAENWPHAESMFEFTYWFFGVFFLIELVIKIAGLRGEFVRDYWNWIDSIIVLFWLLGAVFKAGVSAQFLRLVRLARLVRLVRLLKFMRGHMSDSLFVMLAALADCFAATLWAIVLFLVVHGMLAICLNEILVEYYFHDDSFELEGKRFVFEYFGSFSRSFLTVFEFTFANWVTPARVLLEHVDELFILYAVLHKCIIGVAAAGVVGAVFIQETFQVVQMDDAIMVRQALMREKSHSDKMHALFREIDKDGHGSVSLEQWDSICDNEWVQIWLRAQDIKARDAASLFNMIDNGDGQLTAEELITGTAALKGTSAVMTLLRELRETRAGVYGIKREMGAGPA